MNFIAKYSYVECWNFLRKLQCEYYYLQYGSYCNVGNRELVQNIQVLVIYPSATLDLIKLTPAMYINYTKCYLHIHNAI